MKRPRVTPQQIELIDKMMQGYVKPTSIGAAMGFQSGTIYRHLDAMGYRRVYMNAEELALLAKYRASKQSATTGL